MTMPSCDCTLIIPTLNRRTVLESTLRRIAALPDRGYEVIVVDNGSNDDLVELRRSFPRVRWIELGRNLGCAARNVGAAAAGGELLLMLDDDSWPAAGTIDRLRKVFAAEPSLGAAACRVRLADPPHRHDAGGVPGVFFNCGGAVRRAAFMEAGGYPIDFEYYVEEYELCCRLLKLGWSVRPRGDLVVYHGRVAVNRDNNNMLRLLVRNNLRLWDRHAPADMRDDLIAETLDRYRRVARKENAIAGFEAGVKAGRAALAEATTRPSPLSHAAFSSLFGLDAANEAVQSWADNERVERVAVWSRGKGCEQLIDVLAASNICVDAVFDDPADASQWRSVALRPTHAFMPDEVAGIVVGSLSPGIAEDLADELRERFPALPILSAAPWDGVAAREFKLTA